MIVFIILILVVAFFAAFAVFFVVILSHQTEFLFVLAIEFYIRKTLLTLYGTVLHISQIFNIFTSISGPQMCHFRGG